MHLFVAERTDISKQSPFPGKTPEVGAWITNHVDGFCIKITFIIIPELETAQESQLPNRLIYFIILSSSEDAKRHRKFVKILLQSIVEMEATHAGIIG